MRARTASPKGSRPGLPTVHSPKVKRSADVGSKGSLGFFLPFFMCAPWAPRRDSREMRVAWGRKGWRRGFLDPSLPPRPPRLRVRIEDRLAPLETPSARRRVTREADERVRLARAHARQAALEPPPLGIAYVERELEPRWSQQGEAAIRAADRAAAREGALAQLQVHEDAGHRLAFRRQRDPPDELLGARRAQHEVTHGPRLARLHEHALLAVG